MNGLMDLVLIDGDVALFSTQGKSNFMIYTCGDGGKQCIVVVSQDSPTHFSFVWELNPAPVK